MLLFLLLYELRLTQLFLEKGPLSFHLKLAYVLLRSWGLSDHGLQLPACSEGFSGPSLAGRDAILRGFITEAAGRPAAVVF